MAISVRLEDETGLTLANMISPAWLTNWLISCGDTSKTVCLRFVDPYGNTIFNGIQMKVLVDELAVLNASLSEGVVNTAYDHWLAQFNSKDPAIGDYARTYPRPSLAQIQQHVKAIQDLAMEGLGTQHAYLRFVGD
jgi:hypothetical protein